MFFAGGLILGNATSNNVFMFVLCSISITFAIGPSMLLVACPKVQPIMCDHGSPQ